MSPKVTAQDLVEIVRRQSEQIDQLIAQNKALQAENARLKKRIEELERRTRKYAARSAGKRAQPIQNHQDAVLVKACSRTSPHRRRNR